MIKAIVFDVGGTIFESDSVEKEKRIVGAKSVLEKFAQHSIKLNYTPAEMALKLSNGEKEFKKYSSRHNEIDIDAYEFLSKWVLKDDFKKINQQILKIIAPHMINHWNSFTSIAIKKDVVKVLKLLKSKKYKLGIISNTNSCDGVITRLWKYGLYNFFEPYCIYLSAASKIRKPSPDIFIEVCKEMKIKPNEMVYVGDTISRDVIGAKNAKLRACIRIGKTPEGDKKFENTKYDTKYKINNWNEMPTMIERINKGK